MCEIDCVLQAVQRCFHVLKQSHSVSPQVFGEGADSVKKSLEGIFDDTVPDGKVKQQLSSCLLHPAFAASLNAASTLGCKGRGASGRGEAVAPLEGFELVACDQKGSLYSGIWGCQPQRGVSTAHQGNVCPQEDLEAAGSGRCLLVAAVWGFHN